MPGRDARRSNRRVTGITSPQQRTKQEKPEERRLLKRSNQSPLKYFGELTGASIYWALLPFPLASKAALQSTESRVCSQLIAFGMAAVSVRFLYDGF